MNPKIPDLLASVLAAAEKTLPRPSGDARRQEQIEKLHDEVAALAGRAANHPLVNDWTVMLVKLLRKLERMGPFGEAGELARAAQVGLVLLPYVRADLAAALDILARGPATTEQTYNGARRQGSDHEQA